MTTEFNVRIVAFDILEQLPDSWQPSQFKAMLDDLDYGDTSGMSDAELHEMCLASLQDLEAHEAAEVVLRSWFGDRLRDGQIRSCSHEMLDEKLWEHYAEMSFHEDFFHVGSLLFAALPREFPTPDAVRIQLGVEGGNAPGKEALSNPVLEPFVVRLLADGMSDASVLHRLFEDQLVGGPFPEAESIIWIMHQELLNASTLRLEVFSSGYWLDALNDVEDFASHSPDRGDVVSAGRGR